MGLMFHYYKGCAVNNTIISLTLVFSVIVTIIQLVFGNHEASIMVSSIIVAYCTYICFSAVHSNPVAECNPYLINGINNSENNGAAAVSIVYKISSLKNSVVMYNI